MKKINKRKENGGSDDQKEQWRIQFESACSTGDVEAVKTLCHRSQKEWADVHGQEEWGFRLACEKGNMEVVKYLTISPEFKEAGHEYVNIHAARECGFLWACEANEVEVVKFLTTSEALREAGHEWVDLKKHGMEGLRWACMTGAVSVVQFLVGGQELKVAGQPWMDVNDPKVRAAWKIACEHGYWGIMEWVILGLPQERALRVGGVKRKGELEGKEEDPLMQYEPVKRLMGMLKEQKEFHGALERVLEAEERGKGRGAEKEGESREVIKEKGRVREGDFRL